MNLVKFIVVLAVASLGYYYFMAPTFIEEIDNSENVRIFKSTRNGMQIKIPLNWQSTTEQCPATRNLGLKPQVCYTPSNFQEAILIISSKQSPGGVHAKIQNWLLGNESIKPMELQGDGDVKSINTFRVYQVLDQQQSIGRTKASANAVFFATENAIYRIDYIYAVSGDARKRKQDFQSILDSLEPIY